MSINNYTPIDADQKRKILKNLNVSGGIRILRLKDGFEGKPFFLQVRDEVSGKYHPEAFDTLEELERTANEKITGFRAGTDSAGRVDAKMVLDLLMARLVKRKRKVGTRGDIQRFIEAAIAYGIKDLKDPLVIAKAERFLDSYSPKCGFGRRTKPRSARTVAKYIGFLRQWANECLIAKPKAMLMVNPFMALEIPPQEDHEMEVLTLQECERLVSNEALARREGLHWMFRLYTTMRRREATWVRWEHIDFEGRRIRVRLPDEIDTAEAVRLGLNPETEGKAVKRDKARRARLDPELAAELVKLRPIDGKGYVFPESMRSRASNNEGKAFRNHLKACGINRTEITPHELRSTGACIWAGLIEEDRLLRHLGHGEKAMTRHYTAQADEFEEAMVGWKGRWCLRSRCTSGVTEASIQALVVTDENMDPKDEIGDDWFVVLADTKGLATISL